MAAKVSATASLGFKKSLGHKTGFTQYDNTSPNHSITFSRDIEGDLTDEQLVEEAEHLHQLARDLVESRVQKDLKEAMEVE